MKAAEWKSWCLLYCRLLLRNFLPAAHYKNWIDSVDACCLQAKPCIRKDEVQEAHEKLIKICKGCERFYGRQFIAPNMHMHAHLKLIIEDFGLIYAFWLSSFERYNGL